MNGLCPRDELPYGNVAAYTAINPWRCELFSTIPYPPLSKGRLSDELLCNAISDERGNPRVISCG